MEIKIIGAGLSGLIAACRIKNADIIESNSRMENHKALLRFRDESVSNITGIKFRPVTVHKEIYYNRQSYSKCSVELANRYSNKVMGGYVGDRSIWNLDTVTRYIAPPDFYDQLVDRHEREKGIYWNCEITEIPRGNGTKYISTIPMPAIIEACGLNVDLDFSFKSIEVQRYRLPPGTDLYQTIYFPETSIRVYRASITGDLLIVEALERPALDWYLPDDEALAYVLRAFGMCSTDVDAIESVQQRYGKIVELPKEARQGILYELTRDFNVFSLGRFACWRNILLDYVAKDIDIVQRLINASVYSRELILSNKL